MTHRISSCIALLLLVTLAPTSSAGPYHNSTYSYNLTVPSDWFQIPAASVDAMARAISNPNARKTVIYDAAFQPVANKEPFTYPYMVVQVLPYANVGVNRQVREDEFPGIVKAITGIDIKKAADAQLSPQARALVGGASFGTPKLDNARHRFIVPLKLAVNGVGNVKGQVTGYFGHDALVQIAVYSQTDDPANPKYQQIVDSFTFDPSADFVPSNNPLQALLKNPAQLIGVGVGVLIALGFFFYFKVIRPNNA